MVQYDNPKTSAIPTPTQLTPPRTTLVEEVKMLNQQMEAVQHQISDIFNRVETLTGQIHALEIETGTQGF